MTFEDVKRIRENPMAEEVDNQELHRLIDIALEKQIPKKPLNITLEYDGYYGDCPNCKNVVAEYKNFHYCTYCGQKLDWGDTE